FFEYNKVVQFLSGSVFHANDFKIDVLQTAIVVNEQAFFAESASLLHLFKTEPQLQLQAALDHLQQIQAGITGRGVQKTSGLTDKLNDVEFTVHHDTDRGIPVQQNLISGALQIHPSWRSFGLAPWLFGHV